MKNITLIFVALAILTLALVAMGPAPERLASAQDSSSAGAAATPQAEPAGDTPAETAEARTDLGAEKEFGVDVTVPY